MTDPRYAEARQFLIETAGGYFRNTIHEPRTTCETCARPVDGYLRCYKCARHSTLVARPDLVTTVTYAYPGHQSGATMYRYKDPQPPPANVTAVTFLASYALVVHRACMEAAVGQGFTHWTVVPSLKQPVAASHPLRDIVAMAAPGLELGVTRATAVVNPRDVTPANFVVPDVELAGAHVVIIDDTWTTGGHAMSLAVALKQAGAPRVSVIALARWLDPRDELSKNFISTRLTTDFEPDLCPLTGVNCQP